MYDIFTALCVSQCLKAIRCVMLYWFSASGWWFIIFNFFTFCFHFRLCFLTTGTHKQCNQLQKLLSKWIQGVCSDPNRVPTQVSYCHVTLTDFREIFCFVLFCLFSFVCLVFVFHFSFFFPLCEWKEYVVLSAAIRQYCTDGFFWKKCYCVWGLNSEWY